MNGYVFASIHTDAKAYMFVTLIDAIFYVYIWVSMLPDAATPGITLKVETANI